MKHHFLTIALACVGLLLTLGAHADYQQEQMQLDSQAMTFVHAEGFAEVDVDSLTDESYYSERHFPELEGGPTSISWPDADVDGMTRAVLLLDAHEGPLPHARYLLRYSMNISTEYPELVHDYVEVTRFNLGPERRRDLLEYVAEEHVADPDEFGVGPHVSWRFALAPIMGMRAGLMYASRKEVPDSQAKKMYCLGESCLSLMDAQGPGTDWNPMETPRLDKAVYRDKSPLGSTRAARVVQELWAGLSAHGMDPLPYTPGQPQFIFVTSIDVSGQDASASGLVKQAMVLDDSVREVWTRRDEAAGMQADFMQSFVSRR